MGLRIILRAGIRKHRGSLLGIAVLLFLVSLTFTTVLTIYLSGGTYIRKEIERAGFGTFTAWVSQVPDEKALIDQIKIQEGIEEAEIQNLIYADYEANGVESDSEGQLIPWSAGDQRYRFIQNNQGGYRKAPQKIASKEVYVSPSMVSVMDLAIGDTLAFTIARGGERRNFTVAGYYEDPFMGSSMIGMKGFLISEADYEALLQTVKTAGMDSLAREGGMIHISTKEDQNLSVSMQNQFLNENTPLFQYTEFVHSADAIGDFMVILQNAFCGLLAAFALLLLGAVLVVLEHSISGIMAQEYRNLGILKTIGYTGKRLMLVQLMQYGMAIGAGILLGVWNAIPMTKLASKRMLTTTGVLLPSNLPMVPCLAVVGVVVLLLAGFLVWKMKRIILLTPMAAIRGDREEISWKPGTYFGIRAKNLPVWLAVRQLWSGRKRYGGVCLIAALLVLFASLAGRIDAWLGPDGKGMMDAFHPADLTIGVQVLGDLEPEEVENRVEAYTDITDGYLLAMPSVSIQGRNYTANVITEPERYHISQGTTSRRADEIVLTETAASDLGIAIGDRVMVQGDVGSREFKVAGIYHCANDMGANIGMSREGYLTIGQDHPQLWCHHYFLADEAQKEVVTQALETAYGGDLHVHENTWPGLTGILGAMRVLLGVMYGIIAVFILIVTSMTGSKILMAEQRDLGIYKAIGYSTRMLRITFSLRFGIVAAVGAIAGTILASQLTDPLVSSVMRLAGISNFASHPAVGTVLAPGIAVIAMFLGFAYLAAYKIKKMDMMALTAE